MCTEQKHGRKRVGSVALSVATLSTESAALSVESPRFLGKRSAFYRKSRFLNGAEHVHCMPIIVITQPCCKPRTCMIVLLLFQPVDNLARTIKQTMLWKVVINSTYGADALVLVHINTDSA